MKHIDDYLLDANQEAIDRASDGDGYAVIRDVHFNRLKEATGQAVKNNAQARDIKRLIHLALTTQDAANPRPLSTLLTNLTHTVMADGGNPAYQNSPAVRLVLHQMLWLLDGSSLPAYDKDSRLYMQDVQACEDFLGIKTEV